MGFFSYSAALGSFALVIALVIWAVYRWVDDFTVGTTNTIPTRTLHVTVDARQAETLKIISEFIVAQRAYRIDHYDLPNGYIVLNQPLSWRRFGCLYTIKVRAVTGKTKIEVGLKSKWALIGPWAEKVEEMQLLGLMNALRASLGAAGIS